MSVLWTCTKIVSFWDLTYIFIGNKAKRRKQSRIRLDKENVSSDNSFNPHCSITPRSTLCKLNYPLLLYFYSYVNTCILFWHDIYLQLIHRNQLLHLVLKNVLPWLLRHQVCVLFFPVILIAVSELYIFHKCTSTHQLLNLTINLFETLL